MRRFLSPCCQYRADPPGSHRGRTTNFGRVGMPQREPVSVRGKGALPSSPEIPQSSPSNPLAAGGQRLVRVLSVFEYRVAQGIPGVAGAFNPVTVAEPFQGCEKRLQAVVVSGPIEVSDDPPDHDGHRDLVIRVQPGRVPGARNRRRLRDVDQPEVLPYPPDRRPAATIERYRKDDPEGGLWILHLCRSRRSNCRERAPAAHGRSHGLGVATVTD